MKISTPLTWYHTGTKWENIYDGNNECKIMGEDAETCDNVCRRINAADVYEIALHRIMGSGDAKSMEFAKEALLAVANAPNPMEGCFLVVGGPS